LGQCYIPHPVSVAKWHNRTGNQLKWNCIHSTVLVKLYSSHFASEMVGENSSNKHFSQAISNNPFLNNLVFYLQTGFFSSIFIMLWVPLF